VSGQFGSVQRTARTRRELRDDEAVLEVLEDAGVPRERVMGVDPDKVEDALEVTELKESDVYEIKQTEYVRKAEVEEDVKESRLQGPKDRLATTDDPEAEELREEIEEPEDRIEELTEFKSGEQSTVSKLALFPVLIGGGHSGAHGRTAKNCAVNPTNSNPPPIANARARAWRRSSPTRCSTHRSISSGPISL